MNGYSKQLKILAIGLILLSLIFLLEITTEALIGTVAYTSVVIYILWLSGTRKHLIAIGAISSVFIIAAFLLLYQKAESYPVIVINRTLSLAVIWLAVHFTFRFNKVSDEQNIKSEQLSALFENANEGILFTDKDGNITLANPFLENIFGYGPGELIHKNISVLIPENFVFDHTHHVEDFSQNPTTQHKGRELQGRHKNGTVFPIEINLSHFYRYGQLNVIAFVIDATEKKQHQRLIEESLDNVKNYNLKLEKEVKQRTLELEQSNKELQRSQYLYKAMAHHFPGGIIGVLDKNMKYLIVDGKDLNLLALNKETKTGDRIFDIHSAISGYGEGVLHKVFKGENISFDTVIKEKHYNISSVPIPNAANEINEILVVVKNITEQRNLEKDLLKNLEKEKELNLLKSRFVTTASHEFRSPLTTILSSAFLLEHYTGEQLDQERKKHLARIKRAVHGMTELMNDFLSIGKLEEGKIILTFTEVNIKDFIEDFLLEMALVKKDGQQIEVRFDGNTDSFVTDTKLLNNILRNLFSNAIKYTPPSGTIDLSVAERDNAIVIQIKDSGIGIPVEEQKHIFERFFRAKNSAEIQGTGLGLNIVKKYVHLLKGSIDFTSIQDKGTTFTITLPISSILLKPTKSLI